MTVPEGFVNLEEGDPVSYAKCRLCVALLKAVSVLLSILLSGGFIGTSLYLFGFWMCMYAVSMVALVLGLCGYLYLFVFLVQDPHPDKPIYVINLSIIGVLVVGFLHFMVWVARHMDDEKHYDVGIRYLLFLGVMVTGYGMSVIYFLVGCTLYFYQDNPTDE